MRKLLLLSLISLFISCQTNPPTQPINPVLDYGTIKVISNISDAKIFLDGYDTGKTTPDTFKVQAGTHLIKLVKEFYDTVETIVIAVKNTLVESSTNMIAAGKIVLIEDFANVSCTPCVTSNKILEQLTNNTFGRKKLVAIKYPTNFPSPVDPFFLANGPDCNARMSYYSVIVAPTNIVNGKLKPTPSDSNDVKQKIYSELAKIPQFKLTVNHAITGSTYNISVSVEVKDLSNLDFSKLVLQTVVTETDIEFSTPPGSNGETKFYDVMRKMLPSNLGESLASISQTGVYNFTRQIEINSGWNQGNLNTVVFIQNKDTKEIYQAGSTFN